MENAKHTSTSSSGTLRTRAINVLWSSRTFGGAEVYVETMSKTWGTQTCALQALSAKQWFVLVAKIAFGSDMYIFHDVRAALLCFLRPTRRNITVIHGPGKRPWLTRAIIKIQSFIQRRLILVATDIYPGLSIKRVQVLENFSSAGIDARDITADAVYFGRIDVSKRVDRMLDFWAVHSPKGLLHVIGDGSLLPELRRRYERSSNIVFYGALSHSKIAEIASCCRYYISFSDREGLSLSLLEAMDGGLIPLVTAIPSQLFVQQIPALPIVRDDPVSLANDILTIDLMPEAERHAIRTACRTLVQQRFRNHWISSWSIILDQTPLQ